MPNNRMERFTQRARRVLMHAQEAAERLNHNVIDTEHMLLGLMREPDGVAGRVLTDMGLEQIRVEDAVKELTKAGERKPNQALDLSPGTKRCLELAVDQARRLDHHYIGTEHLLLGLLRVDQTQNTAVAVLQHCGLNPDEIRERTLKILRESPVQPSRPPGPGTAPQPRPPVPPLESARRQGPPMTTQGQAFQVLSAAITRILDMVESNKLTPAQAAEILGGLQPYLKSSTSEAAQLIAQSLITNLPEDRMLRIVVRDIASGAVKLEVVLPLMDNLDGLVNAAASDYSGWLWMTDMDDKNRIEIRVEKDETETQPPAKEDDDANP